MFCACRQGQAAKHEVRKSSGIPVGVLHQMEKRERDKILHD